MGWNGKICFEEGLIRIESTLIGVVGFEAAVVESSGGGVGIWSLKLVIFPGGWTFLNSTFCTLIRGRCYHLIGQC